MAQGMTPSKGVPAYDFDVNLENVGFPNYYYDDQHAQTRPDQTLLDGPSVAVVGVKRKEQVNNLQGLGIGNEYDLTAIARAQVYYLYNPNRQGEKASLFNPYWAARLAPIDSDQTPTLLRKGLPYVAGMGLPLTSTH